MAFNKFRKRDDYYDFHEPVAPTKPAPPTPRSLALEGTIAYSNTPTPEAYKNRIDAFSEILAAQIESEQLNSSEVESDVNPVSEELFSEVKEEEKYEKADIRRVFHSDNSMSWDIGYREYLLGARVAGELFGAWIQKEADLFSGTTYDPFFILFGRAYEHGEMGEGVLIDSEVNLDAIKFLFPGKEPIGDTEDLEKFLAEGGEGDILYLRFRGTESILES